MNVPAPDEPLTDSAALAHRLAREHCRVDTVTGESCAWYHGFWQFMRLMGVAKASGGHVRFLTDGLRALARNGSYKRLLVSGAADYSMAAHASWAYRQEGAELDLIMVDQCETPLALTRWYCARYGLPFTGHCSNILDFDSSPHYDVIITNSLLGFFGQPERTRLFGRWAALLRRGGKVLFDNRIRPGAGYDPVGFTAEQARNFIEIVRAEAERLRAVLPLPPDGMAMLAADYAERRRPVPVRSSAEVVDLLVSNGFQIEHLDTAAAAGRAAGGAVAGPTLAEATDYVRVIATRT